MPMSATKSYHHDTIEAAARQAVKERPILFSGPMVRAIIEGRKTQTRRIIKPQPYQDAGGWWHFDGFRPKAKRNTGAQAGSHPPDEWTLFPYSCPYGSIGQRLWVRETWAHEYGGGYLYKATHAHMVPGDCKWRPSIHMPRIASRLLLEITDISVQSLQYIGQQDAIDEGVMTLPNRFIFDQLPDYETRYLAWERDGKIGRHPIGPSPYERFSLLWKSIHGPESWESNPYVWAITFKPV